MRCLCRSRRGHLDGSVRFPLSDDVDARGSQSLASTYDTLMDTALFDELQTTLNASGPTAAIDRLCESLRERKDYHRLFYALLMKKRHELGVSPMPTGPSSDLPTSVHQPYEEAIRDAARLVGGLFLDANDIPQSYAYFRMIGEPGPVAAALERAAPEDGDDLHSLIQIAFYEGVLPRKGFDWVVDRLGTCNAITTIGHPELPLSPEDRLYCQSKLVRTLHRELVERLKADIAQREGSAPATDSIRELLAGRDWLTEEEFAHIDTSHLSSVVQMSVQLPRGAELNLARELCLYGARLAPRLRYPGEPPFEDQYADYGAYLDALAGERVEEAVAQFRAKAEAAEEGDTYPAEVLVNLLLRLDRPAEALAVARRWLANADGRRLACPGVTELCQRTGDYRALAEVAREQGDPVHFMAGLLASSPPR